MNSLDVRQPINLFKQRYPDIAIVWNIASIENDLVLTINLIVTIRLKDALRNNWYEKLDVYLETNIPKNIMAMDDDIWTMVKAPLIFTDDKKFIVLTNLDVEEETKIILMRNIMDYQFFRHEDHLILTNCITYVNDCFTMLFRRYFQNPEFKKKLSSCTFKFFDQDIQLQDYQEEIEKALDFSEYLALVASNTTETYPFLNSTDFKNHFSNQETSIPLFNRTKRQVKLDKASFLNEIHPFQLNQSFEEKNYILEMAEDYSEKFEILASKNKHYQNKKNPQKKKFKKQFNTSFTIQKQTVQSIVKKEKMNSIKQVRTDTRKLETVLKPFKLTPVNHSSKLNVKDKFLSKNSCKSETTNQNKGKSFIYFNNKERYSFVPNKVYHQVIEPAPTKTQPKTISYKKTKFHSDNKSDKSNSFRSLSSVIEKPDFNSTLMLLRLMTSKLSSSSHLFHSDTKQTKKMARAEREISKIKSKTYFV